MYVAGQPRHKNANSSLFGSRLGGIPLARKSGLTLTFEEGVMRKKVWFALGLLTLVAALGCAAKKTPSTLPPGAINQFDATSFRVLSDAQAAINSVKSDIAAGKIKPSDAEKKILNQIIADYNKANDLYQAYHAGATTDTTGLSQAITQLISDIAAVTTQIQGGKK